MAANPNEGGGGAGGGEPPKPKPKTLRRFTTVMPFDENPHGANLDNAMTPAEMRECTLLLRKSPMFSGSPDPHLRRLARHMRRVEFEAGEVLVREGAPQNFMFALAKGDVRKLRTVDGEQRIVVDSSTERRVTFGSYRMLRHARSDATVKAVGDTTAYVLDQQHLVDFLKAQPSHAIEVINNLASEVQRQAELLEPRSFLDQRSNIDAGLASVWPVSVGASIESFYRSGMNALINQALTGHRAAFFPSMHTQVPTRVLYINGFKQLRAYFDNNVDTSNNALLKLGVTLTPGVVMTPVSSVLEAANAGHMNPEPLHRRWMRGATARMGREVIFGIGINQLSDYCEERMPFEGAGARNMAGSLVAGVCAGYLSHVPHNLSTMKLLKPDKSYAQHFREFAQASEARLPGASEMDPAQRRFLGSLYSVVFPKGCLIRTMQIVGSFVILNGTIHKLKEWRGPFSTDGPSFTDVLTSNASD